MHILRKKSKETNSPKIKSYLNEYVIPGGEWQTIRTVDSSLSMEEAIVALPKEAVNHILTRFNRDRRNTSLKNKKNIAEECEEGFWDEDLPGSALSFGNDELYNGNNRLEAQLNVLSENDHFLTKVVIGCTESMIEIFDQGATRTPSQTADILGKKWVKSHQPSLKILWCIENQQSNCYRSSRYINNYVFEHAGLTRSKNIPIKSNGHKIHCEFRGAFLFLCKYFPDEGPIFVKKTLDREFEKHSGPWLLDSYMRNEVAKKSSNSPSRQWERISAVLACFHFYKSGKTCTKLRKHVVIDPSPKPGHKSTYKGLIGFNYFEEIMKEVYGKDMPFVKGGPFDINMKVRWCGNREGFKKEEGSVYRDV